MSEAPVKALELGMPLQQCEAGRREENMGMPMAIRGELNNPFGNLLGVFSFPYSEIQGNPIAKGVRRRLLWLLWLLWLLCKCDETCKGLYHTFPEGRRAGKRGVGRVLNWADHKITRVLRPRTQVKTSFVINWVD